MNCICHRTPIKTQPFKNGFFYLTENKARNKFEYIRWPDGPSCPHCNYKDSHKLVPKPNSKQPVREGVYRCRICKKQYTVTVGTIFEGSHISLDQWLKIIDWMCRNKNGINAYQIHKKLGITYKTAWYAVQRIRYAIGQSPLKQKLDFIFDRQQVME
jgi:transposase-like protein